MKLQKSPKNLQIIADEKVIQEFPLITSVVFYKANWFRKEIRWKVIDDSSYLAPIIHTMTAKMELTDQDVEILNVYESELQAVKDADADSRRDLMSTGARITSNKMSLYADSNLEEIIYIGGKNGK